MLLYCNRLSAVALVMVATQCAANCTYRGAFLGVHLGRLYKLSITLSERRLRNSGTDSVSFRMARSMIRPFSSPCLAAHEAEVT